MIYTVGYGTRDVAELFALLDAHGVRVLADVRSAPYSRYRPEFSRAPLAAAAERRGLRYLYLGDRLGGRPPDLARLGEGLAALREEGARGPVCLLCAELKPETCHRSRLVGEALAANGIAVHHLDEHGVPRTQAEIRRRLTGGQLELFP